MYFICDHLVVIKFCQWLLKLSILYVQNVTAIIDTVIHNIVYKIEKNIFSLKLRKKSMFFFVSELD